MDSETTPLCPKTQSGRNGTTSTTQSTSSSASSVDNSSTKRKAIPTRSWTKDYFYKVDEKSVCRICNEQVKTYNSSSTELIKHLSTHNIDENTDSTQLQCSKKFKLDFSDLSDSDESDKENDSGTRYTSVRKQNRINHIHQKLIAFILNNNLPFNIIDSPDFQALIDSIRKDFYKLPCRQTVRNTLLVNIVSNINT